MSGRNLKLYTAEQVRCLDTCAINDHGIDAYELMKRAGQAVFDLAQGRYRDADAWVVVCGAGNNAGDGYVIARLAKQAGKRVRVYALTSAGRLKNEASIAAREWQSSGGQVVDWPPADEEDCPDLIIDALLGTGLDRPVEGGFADAIGWMNDQPCPAIAVDIPSGLNADTGQVMGMALKAELTLSFIGLKQGLVTCDGPDYTGEISFDSLEIPDAVYASVTGNGEIIHNKLLLELLKRRNRNSHKGQFGHLLVVGGNAGMGGAVRLAGEAALRSGSGLVTVATHPDHAPSLNLTRPELMVNGISRPQQLETMLAKATTVAIGPGLGTNKWSRQLLHLCLESGKPLVLDADGLNLLALKTCKRNNWILTPHPAEAGRLLNISAAEIQSNRIESACKIAAQFNAVVVLKGCGSVLAKPTGKFAICPLGNPGMATAGSGDVLTGVIAAFLGQGFDLWNAARAGVVAHAAAGDLAASALGEQSMLAGDIIDSLHQVLV